MQALCAMVRNETTTNKQFRDFVRSITKIVRFAQAFIYPCNVLCMHIAHINAHWQVNKMDFHMYTFQCQLMQHSFACYRYRSSFMWYSSGIFSSPPLLFSLVFVPVVHFSCTAHPLQVFFILRLRILCLSIARSSFNSFILNLAVSLTHWFAREGLRIDALYIQSNWIELDRQCTCAFAILEGYSNKRWTNTYYLRSWL